MSAGLARLDRAGDLDRAREQQQLLGQRGLTRVRVGNDGKRAAALDLFFDFGGSLGFGHNPRLSVTRIIYPPALQSAAAAHHQSPRLR